MHYTRLTRTKGILVFHVQDNKKNYVNENNVYLNGHINFYFYLYVVDC